jgi:hypothetical protein
VSRGAGLYSSIADHEPSVRDLQFLELIGSVRHPPGGSIPLSRSAGIGKRRAYLYPHVQINVYQLRLYRHWRRGVDGHDLVAFGVVLGARGHTQRVVVRHVSLLQMHNPAWNGFGLSNSSCYARTEGLRFLFGFSREILFGGRSVASMNGLFWFDKMRFPRKSCRSQGCLWY